MRIGHFMHGIWKQGGKASYILRTAAAQAEAGHEVFLFDTQAQPEVDNDGNYTFVRVASRAALFSKAADLHVDILNVHGLVGEFPDVRIPVARTLHTHLPYCPSGSQYLKRWGHPCHRTYSLGGCLWGHLVDHCGSVRPQNMYRRYKRIQRERRALSSRPTITVSRFLKRKMVRSGYPEENISVLHSPAPEVTGPYVAPPADGVPRFAFLGRIVPQKGVEWLLRATARVDAPIHVDLAGEGYQRPDMQQLAEELGLTDRVTFHGWLSSDEVERLIVAARAVVFPSVWHEPAGLVTLEAAAHGRLVIASRVGGIPEYATEDYALLVPPNDIDALARSMERVAGNRKLAERMGRKGRKIVRSRFAMKDFIQKLDEIYGAIIDKETTARSVEARP